MKVHRRGMLLSCRRQQRACRRGRGGPSAAVTRAKCREHDSSVRRLLLTASLLSCGTMKPHLDLGAVEATLQGQGVLKSTVSGSNHHDHVTT